MIGRYFQVQKRPL